MLLYKLFRSITGCQTFTCKRSITLSRRMSNGLDRILMQWQYL